MFGGSKIETVGDSLLHSSALPCAIVQQRANPQTDLDDSVANLRIGHYLKRRSTWTTMERWKAVFTKKATVDNE